MKTFQPMKYIKPLVLAILGLSFTTAITAQSGLFNNRGAVVYINNGALVRVLGTVVNKDGTAVMSNNGNFYIDNNFVNDSLVNGNGKYYLQGNWVNNDQFVAGTSEVILEGANQLITGTVVSNFYDLTLTNSGIKTQTLNATVSHVLNLNDRELATEQFDMDILTTNTNAITRTSGFVSSLGNGKLYRATALNNTYLFPTGSSVGAIRYRPASITPSTTQAGRYGVRMVNNDATLDGFDRNLTDSLVCNMNPNWYHRINRTLGNVPVTVAAYYDPAFDGNWDFLANWSIVPTNRWTGMDPTLSASVSGLVELSHANWANFGQEPYIIGLRRPNPPTIVGSDLLCGNTSGNLYEIDPTLPGGTYNWTINGGTINSGNPGEEVSVAWGNSGSGIISATVTASNGCVSGISAFNVQLFIQPTASFVIDTNNIFAFDIISIIDSSQGAVSWSYDLGNGVTTPEQNPFAQYDTPGVYDVCLTVTSNDGCTDTLCQEITVVEGIIIPNVFTPNGDGFNDVFDIKNSGLTQYDLKIFNRWGTLLFETQNPQVKWDGRTQAGELVSSGTYLFILRAIGPNTDVDKQGTVTVLH